MTKKTHLYEVVPFGGKWAIIPKGDEHARPVGEHLYTQATHAYRARRRLEKAAHEIDTMVKRDGAIIL